MYEYTWFWWGNLRERYNLEGLSVGWSIILKLIFKKCDGATLPGLLWFRIGKAGVNEVMNIRVP
jgi:hypothetical protein